MHTGFDFSAYRVLVAGGSKGIGRSIALAFAQHGAAVSVCARGQPALDAVEAELRACGGTVHAESHDLGDPQAIAAWVETAAQTLGGIDVLVNNASGYGFNDDDASWEANFRIDLMAAVRASRHALPHLQQSAHASILHLSSIAAQNPRAAAAAYAALKAALSHYTASQALALAPQRIRVNAVAPGSIEFADGLWDRVRKHDPDRYAATLARIPFAAYGRPEDIAHAALFLASPLATWITGQVLSVDGGQSLHG